MVYVKAWLISTRPKTLLLSVFPFVLGSLLAMPLVIHFNFWLMTWSVLSALFIQIGTNLINDAYDVKKGADRETRLGPNRGLQAGLLTEKEVFYGGLLCFGLALLAGLPLIQFGGVSIGIILGISVICGFIYTGGPMPLAYHGLGELFVLVFFGLVSTLAAYFFQTGRLDEKPFLLGLQLGTLATLPIAINNLRDIREDTLVNKRTLAARFGKFFARIEITLLAFIPFVLNFFWESFLASILPWLALPLACFLVSSIWIMEPSRLYNKYLGLSILLYIVFSLLLIIGYLA